MGDRARGQTCVLLQGSAGAMEVDCWGRRHWLRAEEAARARAVEAQARGPDCCARLCVATVGSSGYGRQGTGTCAATGVEAGHDNGGSGQGTWARALLTAKGGLGGKEINEYECHPPPPPLSFFL